MPVKHYFNLKVVSKHHLTPNNCVGDEIQLLEILEYVCGLNSVSALFLGAI